MTHSAIIITIGDELLIGQVIDTNSAWIAQQLNRIGISVVQRIAIADDAGAIRESLDRAIPEADVLFITGGLGPTRDDITKNTLMEYFGGKPVMNEQVRAHVNALFAARNRPMLPANEMQAIVPDNCTVLFNHAGTAPGMWFERDRRVIISLPGVPYEMKTIVTGEVLHRLQARFGGMHIVHRTLLVMGIGESVLADMISDIESDLPSFVRLAYLPGSGTLRLRLTGRHADYNLVERTIEQAVAGICARMGDKVAACEDVLLEEVIAQLLRAQEKSLGFAESCTGGYLSHLMTNIPGSSLFFKGAVVSYAYDVKSNVLSVPESLLAEKGAVSREVVLLMAENARKTLGADIALSVSGILGPGGGTVEKPVGMVWMAIADGTRAEAQLFQFRFNRIHNKERAAYAAFEWLRQWLLHPEH